MTELLWFISKANIQHHSNPIYVPNTEVEKGDVDQFYEALQHFEELTPKKDVPFIIGDWNTKVRSQEIPRRTWKFDFFGVKNEAG